jgi:hypothetical protein
MNLCIGQSILKNLRSVEKKGSSYNEIFIFVTQQSTLYSKEMISWLLPTTAIQCVNQNIRLLCTLDMSKRLPFCLS